MIECRYLLFDLDGTLIDPIHGFIASIKYALTELGERIPDERVLSTFIGPPLKESFMNICGFDDVKADNAVKAYRRYYGTNGIFDCNVYDGVSEVLSVLKSRGFHLFIATSKPSVFAEQIAEHFQFSTFFTEIVGSELNGERSNKVEVIKCILDKYQINPADATMIGDRKYDVIPALELGLKTIAVTYGYGDNTELTKANPNIIIEKFNKLLSVLTYA